MRVQALAFIVPRHLVSPQAILARSKNPDLRLAVRVCIPCALLAGKSIYGHVRLQYRYIDTLTPSSLVMRWTIMSGDQDSA